MPIEKRLDDILNTKSKVKILRLFISRRDDFMASGSDVARLIKITPPATHSSLKELYDNDILRREIVGKQHIYKLNSSNRIVKDILKPAFRKECSIKEDIKDFIIEKIKAHKATNFIVSLILYGSIARDETHRSSDCDIAVVVQNAKAKEKAEDLFIEKISAEFSGYFGISLDTYIKTYSEFIGRLKKHLPPVSTLMKSYEVIYGKDPINYR